MCFAWLAHPLRTYRQWREGRARRRFLRALAFHLCHLEARERTGDGGEDLERHRIALEDAAARGDFSALDEWIVAPRVLFRDVCVSPGRVLPKDWREPFHDPAAWWFAPFGDFVIHSPPERAEGLERRQHWQGEITRALRARLDPAATRAPQPPRGATGRLSARLALFARLDDAPPPPDVPPPLDALARQLIPLPARDSRFARAAHRLIVERFGADTDYHTAEYLDRYYLRVLAWIGDDAAWNGVLARVWREINADALVTDALNTCVFYGSHWE